MSGEVRVVRVRVNVMVRVRTRYLDEGIELLEGRREGLRKDDALRGVESQLTVRWALHPKQHD